MSEHMQHLRSRSMLPSCARRCLGCSSLPCARNRGVASCTTTRYLRSASARSSNTRPCTRHTPPSNRAFAKFATTVRWLVITQKECEAEDAKGGGGERLLAEKVTKGGRGYVETLSRRSGRGLNVVRVNEELPDRRVGGGTTERGGRTGIRGRHMDPDAAVPRMRVPRGILHAGGYCCYCSEHFETVQCSGDRSAHTGGTRSPTRPEAPGESGVGRTVSRQHSSTRAPAR